MANQTTLVDVQLENKMSIVFVLVNLTLEGVGKVVCQFIAGLGERPDKADIAAKPLAETLLPHQVEQETDWMVSDVKKRCAEYLIDYSVVEHYVPITENCGAYMFIPAACLREAKEKGFA